MNPYEKLRPDLEISAVCGERKIGAVPELAFPYTNKEAKTMSEKKKPGRKPGQTVAPKKTPANYDAKSLAELVALSEVEQDPEELLTILSHIRYKNREKEKAAQARLDAIEKQFQKANEEINKTRLPLLDALGVFSEKFTILNALLRSKFVLNKADAIVDAVNTLSAVNENLWQEIEKFLKALDDEQTAGE